MSKHFLSLSSFLLLLGLGSSLNPAIASVPQHQVVDSSRGFLISGLTLPLPNGSSPASTAGGGKRGGCINREARSMFIPVMSNNEANTVSSAPSLWWNIPKNQAVRAEFSIFKQTGDADALVHYQVINDISGKSGLLQVSVPANTLAAGSSYWWDLTLACDTGGDRSGDMYLWGSINRLDPSKLSIQNSPVVIKSLAATLLGQDSYISLDKAEARELGMALQNNPNASTISMVETRLRNHYIGLQNDYVKLGESIRKLQQNSSVDVSEMKSMKTQLGSMVLELAQLSAYFGAWGDTVNFLAAYRTDHPDEWKSLVETIAPADNPSTTEVNEHDMIVKALMTAQNF